MRKTRKPSRILRKPRRSCRTGYATAPRPQDLFEPGFATKRSTRVVVHAVGEADPTEDCGWREHHPTEGPSGLTARASAVATTQALAQAHWKLNPPIRPSTSRISPAK